MKRGKKRRVVQSSELTEHLVHTQQPLRERAHRGIGRETAPHARGTSITSLEGRSSDLTELVVPIYNYLELTPDEYRLDDPEVAITLSELRSRDRNFLSFPNRIDLA